MTTTENTANEVHGLPANEYHATPALSYSGMKDLGISALRYWHLHVNPDRTDQSSAEMRFGTALHCAVLEPDLFRERYTCAIDPAFYDGCLVTMDDLRTWCKAMGLPSSAKTKRELIERAIAFDSNVPILDVLEEKQKAEGKRILSQDDWRRVNECADALRNQRHVKAILAAGRSEVSYFALDSETGVPMKARMDWVTPTITLDIKTFSNSRGKSTDRAVADAIFYEAYHKQAYHYTTMRKLANPKDKAPAFIFAFVESEPPYEVRLKRLQPMSNGQTNVYWERARIEIRELIRLYAECSSRFGVQPWMYEQGIENLEDSDIPQLAY